jgi:hypothetical protein
MLLKKKFFISLESKTMIDHADMREHLIWTSSNGKECTYEFLDVNHLRNIVAKMERGELSLKQGLEHLFDLKNELNYRTLLKNQQNE